VKVDEARLRAIIDGHCEHMNGIVSWLARLRARLVFNRRHASDRGALTCTERGVQLKMYRLRSGAIAQETAADFAWSAVRGIRAFKRDLAIVDLVCLAFDLDTGVTVEVNEEMVGFEVLVEALPARFPAMDAQWREHVVLPPFATNVTPVWTRDSSRRAE